jgi:hypothetical protein
MFAVAGLSVSFRAFWYGATPATICARDTGFQPLAIAVGKF